MPKNKGGNEMKQYVRTLCVLSIAVFSLTSLVMADEINFSKAEICKACIATVMFKDPDIIRIDKIKDQIVYLSYVKPTEKKRWAYRCKISGNTIIWASDKGRWRNSQYDPKITYKIDGENILIKERHSDGSGREKSFSFKELN